MEESKWEKYKKKDKLNIVDIDEIVALAIGLIIFLNFSTYRILFIVSVILWYWIKIRFYERKIIEKEKEIYNIYWDNVKPVSQEYIDRKTEQDRKPMRYDLKQLENKRRFLVDKFVVLSLILFLLIELFIKG